MSAQYRASDIGVLTRLEPVQKRPGMHTDTSRPNHLVQEVVDNSVDEAAVKALEDFAWQGLAALKAAVRP